MCEQNIIKIVESKCSQNKCYSIWNCMCLKFMKNNTIIMDSLFFLYLELEHKTTLI